MYLLQYHIRSTYLKRTTKSTQRLRLDRFKRLLDELFQLDPAVPFLRTGQQGVSNLV